MEISSEEYFVKNSEEKISIQTKIYTNKNSNNFTKFLDLCAIILHPHPLYGGEMHNNVVEGIKNVLVNQGICCTTFNFRGVGKSTGDYGDGFGEQDDLINVSNFILNDYENQKIKNLVIVGYSFGAVITLAAANKIKNVLGIVLLSHPFGINSEIRTNYEYNLPKLFINGTKDGIANYSRLLEEFEKFSEPKKIKSIENGDHFYSGREYEAGEEVLKFINLIFYRT